MAQDKLVDILASEQGPDFVSDLDYGLKLLDPSRGTHFLRQKTSSVYVNHMKTQYDIADLKLLQFALKTREYEHQNGVGKLRSEYEQ